jgi:hypothetical protein
MSEISSACATVGVAADEVTELVVEARLVAALA